MPGYRNLTPLTRAAAKQPANDRTMRLGRSPMYRVHKPARLHAKNAR